MCYYLLDVLLYSWYTWRSMGKVCLFYFESKKVSLEICLIISCHLSIIFHLIGAIALDIFGPMRMTCESYIFSFPTILVLRDTQVHVGSSNCCNVVFDIETSINKVFYSGITLRVLDIDPNYSYIWFGRSFNNSGSKYKNSVIKIWLFLITVSIISIEIERLVSLIK